MSNEQNLNIGTIFYNPTTGLVHFDDGPHTLYLPDNVRWHIMAQVHSAMEENFCFPPAREIPPPQFGYSDETDALEAEWPEQFAKWIDPDRVSPPSEYALSLTFADLRAMTRDEISEKSGVTGEALDAVMFIIGKIT
jgi:hypothetical protein